MNIIRRYKIHLLFNCLTDKELKDLEFIFQIVKYCKENYELINYIYNNYPNLKQIKFKSFPNNICYFNNNKIIFIKEVDSKWLLYNNDLIFDNSYFYEICINYSKSNYDILKHISSWYEKELEKQYLNYINELNTKS